MTKLAWGDPTKRFFETGLDRGVLYPKGTPLLGNLFTNLVPNPSIEAAGAPVLVATNYLTNPDFETNATGWTTDFPASVSLARVITDYHSGTACLEAVITAPSTDVYVFTSGTAAINQSWSESIWVRGPAGTSVRTILSVTGEFATSGWVTLTGDWQRITASGVATAAGTVLLGVYITVPTINSGFETDVSGYIGSGANAVLSRSTAQAHSGSASMAITSISAGAAYAVDIGPGPGAFPSYPILPGANHTAQVWMRAATVARLCGLYMQWFDAAGNYLSDSSTVTATDSTTGWTLLSGTFVPPSNARYGRRVFGPQTTAAGEVHYADDALFGMPLHFDDATVVVGVSKMDFNGDTPDVTDWVYAWSGTPHASTSTKSGYTVPNWNDTPFRSQAMTRSTDQAYRGSACLRLEETTGEGSFAPTTVPITVQGNKQYTIQMRMRAETTPRPCSIYFFWYDASNAFLGSVPGAVVNDSTTGWTLVTATATSPSSATKCRIVPYVINIVGGEVHYIDAVMMTEGGVVVDYFDGDAVDTSMFTYAWTGTPNASTSTRQENISIAVPWDGMTGVDEGGAEGAASYYVDGRPFLFLPKPKEFTATLKAYTFPDKFAEIMGETEAADGMYLDSQQGDAFDLSYRTLVGDMVNGVDAGYKIHLIYNATVSPAGRSYGTLGSQINPVEFSWEIQAVPVPVAGYRPTAHVIIDTRHMNATKLAQLEALLYGDDVAEIAHMPDAQTVFDLLSFGDTIVITDNGDGTWTAEGSYHNIYLIGDGVFEIDNVNAVDHGDGTYDISSTP